MHAPQITMIVLYALGIGVHIAKDGLPLKGKHSFFGKTLGVGISAAILYWGGFWG